MSTPVKNAAKQAFEMADARAQSDLGRDPYDSWISPGGERMAEFYREQGGYRVRFPDVADFHLSADSDRVIAHPVPDAQLSELERLAENAIAPIIGNHTGGLFMHGSAVVIEGAGAGFLGASRSGKTTLAASLALSGSPLVTEDVIDLHKQDDAFLIAPKASALRLFADSADHLFEDAGVEMDSHAGGKVTIDPGDDFAVANAPVRMTWLFILGRDFKAPLSIRKLSRAEALPLLLPHSFLLDVEDRPRLRQHFNRLADLTESLDCFLLDYPRDYSALPEIERAIRHCIGDRV